MSDLVENPKHRFSHVEAHIILTFHFDNIYKHDSVAKDIKLKSMRYSILTFSTYSHLQNEIPHGLFFTLKLALFLCLFVGINA